MVPAAHLGRVGGEFMDDLPMKPGSMFKKPGADAVLYLGYGVAELLDHGLAFESFDCIRMSCSGHDDKCDDCHG